MIEKAILAENSYYSATQKHHPVKIILDANSFSFKSSNDASTSIPWNQILKHQVSPASHPKCLLKLVLKQDHTQPIDSSGAITFTFSTRDELESIRRDITNRLLVVSEDSGNKKRKVEAISSSGKHTEDINCNSFTYVAPDMLAVTRAKLLASDPSLSAQHQLLVKETATLSEEDFWSSHRDILAEECARIHGKYRKGISTVMRSNLHLQGVVRLGVEEMRQIFVLYPAVHKAYVEKVPLELSEEQFWKKYLESEYFYRDRGRLGQMAQSQRMEQQPKQGKSSSLQEDEKERKRQLLAEQAQENSTAIASAAVVSGADDIFSRYDAELRRQQLAPDIKKKNTEGRDPRTLAIGQFDLASTVNTERSHLGEGDLHPDTGKSGRSGSLIVQKYNRHWAMVLNPEEHSSAVQVNSNYLLHTAARRSTAHVIPGDDSAMPHGGCDAEMQRLVAFANCDELLADHVNGLGDEEFQDLCLKNEDAYYAGGDRSNPAAAEPVLKDLEQRNFLLSKQVAVEMKSLTSKMFGIDSSVLVESDTSASSATWLPAPDKRTDPEISLPSTVMPLSEVGLPLLKALSKRMGDSTKTDADAEKVASSLPEKFKRQLDSFFRRSSELLRHFFGLRRVIEISKDAEKEKEKLGKIFSGMEVLYKEIEKMRGELPQSPQGEMMRRMCKPIMDQLDLAFKLHYRGGFVSVGSSKFVSVSLG